MCIVAAHAAPLDEAVERAGFAVAGARNIGEAAFDPVAHPPDLFAALQLAEAPVDKGVEFVRRTIARFVEIGDRSEEHTSELQSQMRISYAVFCLKKKKEKKI